MRWLSQPEALFSDFLHDRGIEHKRGERYSADYAANTEKKWGYYPICISVQQMENGSISKYGAKLKVSKP